MGATRHRVILFSLIVGVVILPLLLKGMEVTDSNTYRDEETMAKSVTAEVAIESLKKMQERLEVDTEENIDPQLLTEVSSRVIGSLRRRISTKENAEEMRKVENLERRFRLTALRAERGELYHLRATQKISNETLQKLLHDLDLLEALLVEKS